MADLRAAYNKAWRHNNPDKVRSSNRRAYLKRIEQNKKYARKYYAEHKTEQKAAQRRWREANKNHRTKYQAKWYEKNHEKQILYHRKRNREVKQQVLAAYGKYCACCGEKDWEFLTIDHINGGGTKHRDEIRQYGTAFYQWLKKNGFPSGYRTLCFNCNCALGNLGYCPHQRK